MERAVLDQPSPHPSRAWDGGHLGYFLGTGGLGGLMMWCDVCQCGCREEIWWEQSRAVESMSMSMTRTCDRPKTGRRGKERYRILQALWLKRFNALNTNMCVRQYTHLLRCVGRGTLCALLRLGWQVNILYAQRQRGSKEEDRGESAWLNINI